jgi:hypothetical protein
MIRVVMGIENRCEPDLLLLYPPKHRLGLRGIDDRRLPALFAYNQIPIIVAQKRDLNDFHSMLIVLYGETGKRLFPIPCPVETFHIE